MNKSRFYLTGIGGLRYAENIVMTSERDKNERVVEDSKISNLPFSKNISVGTGRRSGSKA